MQSKQSNSEKHSIFTSVKAKVLIAVAALVLSIGAIVTTDMMAIDELKVGGPTFTAINYDKDLVADIMPPPAYIIESYLEATLAIRDPAHLDAHAARLAELHKEYDARQTYWANAPIDGAIKTYLTQNADHEADAFYDILNAQFLPALKRGDMKAAESSYAALSARFAAHRAFIDKTVALANAHSDASVKSASTIDEEYAIATWGVVALVVLLLCFGIWWALRRLVEPLANMTKAMRKLAEGNLDAEIPSEGRKDEIGELAQAMSMFKNDLKNAEIERRANEAERAARAQEQNARAEEQNNVVASLATGLKGLSGGDLTTNISSAFAADYEGLRLDFNATVRKLSETIATVLSSTSGISTGAGEISQAADDLSKRTEQQAASLEETAAALEEITATVKKTAQNAKEASTIVATAKSAAEDGGRVVETAIQAMGQIAQSSKQITDIIGVIDEIAFQTNLLALNAGVEAARAGDAGKGFAVVASEVRALAQRSSEAAREIKTLIKTSGEQVDSGVKLVGESGTALKRIVDQVVEINALVTEMAQAAQQQSTGIEEVNTAVSQMDQVTQQNAAMVEQSTAASRNLATETSELSRLVSFFNVGAEHAPSHRTAAPPSPSAGHAVARAVPRSARPVASAGRRAATAMKPVVQEDEWEEF